MAKEKKEDFILPADIGGAFMEIETEEQFSEYTSKFLFIPSQKGEVSYVVESDGKMYINIDYSPNGKELVLRTINTPSFAEKIIYLEGFLLKLQGSVQRIKIDKVLQGVVPYEGYFEGSLGKKGIYLVFANPDYLAQKDKVSLNKFVNVNLAALALNIDKAKNNVYKIDKGAFYEINLKYFLEENPDKTKEDYPYAELSTENLRSFCPKDNIKDSVYYRGKVVSVDKIKFFEWTVYHLKVEFHEDFILDVYAPEHSFKYKTYVPAAGDFIEGVLWLSGYLAEGKPALKKHKTKKA